MGLWENITGAVNSSGLTAEVKVAGLPAVRVPLKLDDESSPIIKALRPRVIIRTGTTVLTKIEPAGSPDEGVPWALLGLVGVAVGLFFLGRASA